MNNLLRTFCLSLMGLMPLLIFGKGRPEHVKDMHAVFGTSANEYALLEQMFNSVSRSMDEREPLLTLKIRGIAPRFTEGSYSHRLYFHWGFYGDPSDSAALAERVKNATDAEPNGEQMKKDVYELIRSVGNDRKRRIQLAVQECCDNWMAVKRREMNAIAAWAYDTHILGDYIEGSELTIKALMPMDKLQKSICKTFDRIKKEDQDFACHPEMKLLLQRFNARMRDAAKDSSQSEAAQKMLNAMKEYVPQLLRMTSRIRRALKLADLPANQESRNG